MKRRDFITLVGAAVAWPLVARAQQPTGRMRRIGVLMNLAPDDAEGQARLAAFLQGLQEAGWARDVHCENGSGRIDDGAGATVHRVESGRIGALVRDPEGAASPKRNAPRVHQMRVGCLGQSLDVRDQIRLNIDGIVRAGGRWVRLERR